MGGVSKAKSLGEMYENNWNFLGGGEGGCKTKNLLWGEYGYVLELHNNSGGTLLQNFFKKWSNVYCVKYEKQSNFGNDDLSFLLN